MLRIFLDINQWVNLRYCYENKVGYDKYRDISKILLTKAIHNELILVCSRFQFLEITKRVDISERKKLIDFILKFTKMNSILDYFEISKLEVENEVRKLIGLPLININSKIFQTGLINCFGIKNFKIVPKKGFIPTEKDNFKIKKKFEELDNDFNFISNFLNSEEVHNNSKNILKIENDLKKSIEKLRITEYSHPSKEINEKLAKIRTIDEFTYDNLLFNCNKFNLSFKEISLKIFSSLENTEIFFKNLKTAYVFFILNHTRNSLKNTKIKENDIWDLAVYSSSIPYCDIVIGERRWINILKQKKIDKLYGNKCFTKLDDITLFEEIRKV